MASRTAYPAILFVSLLGFALAAFPSSARAEDAWTKSGVDLIRWPDGNEVITHLDPSTKVSVVYRESGKVRIRHDQDYGWVPQDALADQDPAAAPPPPPLTAIPDEGNQAKPPAPKPEKPQK